MKKSTGIIILAAGSSSRLGRPKQLLQYKGKTLLSHTVTQALTANDAAVMVVTGANREMIETELKNTGAMAIYNPDWELGMGSSVSVGLAALMQAAPELERCIITVCDQPFIHSEILNALIGEQQLSGKGIVASAYVGTLGTPVAFESKYFQDLLDLSGKDGAKQLVEQYSDDVSSVSFEQGAVDIDTVEDYNRLVDMQ